jgi:diguanylate cyclase (GGDEF)-like protein
MPDTILVIDDSPEIRKLVQIRLSKEQFTIHAAHDAASGLAMARQFDPDLILLDVDMPDCDGFTACAELKSDPDTMNIPIIFLTGASSTQEKVRGLEMGAIDYVTKPFDSIELQARVRSALRTKYLLELLSKKAMIDGLTGLWNRTYLDAHMSIELSAARRNGTQLSCIMIDIDHFKSLNDTYGHSFGDTVLKGVATILQQGCREQDIVCRYGGEEFTILLPNTELSAAQDLAERLRSAIELQQFYHRNNSVSVTCSFGVSTLRSTVPPSLVELADRALYEAKRTGRNCVIACPCELQPA